MNKNQKVAEALFEIINKTNYEKEGRKYIDRIINDRNITFNPSNSSITIESNYNDRVLTTITIT